jgi:hypothetical protein
MSSKEISSFRLNSKIEDIHYFFIVNKSGTSFYSRKFTDKYELKANLLGGFCIALMNFSVDMIGNKIKILEMENVKLIIVEKRTFFYVFLVEPNCKSSLLEKISLRIERELLNLIRDNKVNPERKRLCNTEFEKKVDKIFLI